MKAVYPAKGDLPTDAEEVRRTAKATRPLHLKNTDNKVICAAWNYSTKRWQSQYMTPIQRGFTPTRNPVNNIPDLDAASRAFGKQRHRRLQPVAVFWDFLAAFPSLAHSFLFRVLAAMELPAIFMNLIRAIYFHAHTVDLPADDVPSLGRRPARLPAVGVPLRSGLQPVPLHDGGMH